MGCCASSTSGRSVVVQSEGRSKQQEAGGEEPVFLGEQPPLAQKQVVADACDEEAFRRLVRTPQASGAEGTAVHITAVTYNLFWWNLYGQRDGNSGSASRLVAAAMPDLLGCQECDDLWRVLHEGGVEATYDIVPGPCAIAMAYKKADWDLLDQGYATVATDEPHQFFSKRGVQWMRVRHRSCGAVVFFMNHHGPLRVNSGGRDGGPRTAARIASAILSNVQDEDRVILVGSFNAQAGAQTIRELERYLPRKFTGQAFGGVDHVFSPLELIESRNLGAGGSDHDALATTFSL